MGAYLSIVAGAIKLFNFMAAALQQHHDEMNGVTAQLSVDRAAEVKADQNALEVANNSSPKSVSDSLRNGSF